MNNLSKVATNAMQGLEVYLPVEDNRVDARQLHEFLEIGRDFSNWHKQNVERGQFVENQDFTLLAKNVEQTRGGHNRKDYSYTIPMAKEVCMLSNNDKGKMARKYFLAVEETLINNLNNTQLTPKNITGQMVIDMGKAMLEMEQSIKDEKNSKRTLKGHDTRKRLALDDAKDYFDVDKDKDFRYITYSEIKDLGIDPKKSVIKKYIKDNNPKYKIGEDKTWNSLALPMFVWKKII